MFVQALQQKLPQPTCLLVKKYFRQVFSCSKIHKIIGYFSNHFIHLIKKKAGYFPFKLQTKTIFRELADSSKYRRTDSNRHFSGIQHNNAKIKLKECSVDESEIRVLISEIEHSLLNFPSDHANSTSAAWHELGKKIKNKDEEISKSLKELIHEISRKFCDTIISRDLSMNVRCLSRFIWSFGAFKFFPKKKWLEIYLKEIVTGLKCGDFTSKDLNMLMTGFQNMQMNPDHFCQGWLECWLKASLPLFQSQKLHAQQLSSILYALGKLRINPDGILEGWLKSYLKATLPLL
jgi:hypothetical protein